MSLFQKARVAGTILRHMVLPRRVPAFVGYEITNRCNLDCAYCGQKDALDRDELRGADAIALMDRLVDAGMQACHVGGGEPLVHPDVVAVLRRLHGRGVFTGLNTNGWLLPVREEALRHLDLVKVSYDGPEDVHDRQRGPGTHARALRAVELARRRGVPVRLNCTLTSASVPRLDEILAFTRRERLRIKFQPAGAAFAGDRDISAVSPTADQFGEAIRRLRADKRRPGSPVVNSDAALEYLEGWPAPRRYLRCAAGWIYCRVKANGNLYSCSMRQFGTEGVPLAGRTIAAAMELADPGGCRTCFCSSTLELNLILNGGLRRAVFERTALWRGLR